MADGKGAQQSEPGGRAPAVSERLPPELRRIGYLMDESIRLPGGYRIGWDPIIGLIPGIGDAIGLAVSGYVVAQAGRAGIGKFVLARMIANVVIEALIGVVPLVGDVFDAMFKANVRNLRLVERHLANPRSTRRRSAGFVVVVLLALFAGVIAIGAVLVWAIQALAGAIGGG